MLKLSIGISPSMASTNYGEASLETLNPVDAEVAVDGGGGDG
jgi:hypothetical protein